ncbi:MAG TPA: response regulator transcription factor [Pyrinomonadaceae bacterium]|nr:response regulator transcription factor [Pyrinomonadaceae bacterium]
MGSVLIIEDEEHLADGLRFNLEAEGYEVETVGDGESGLALLLNDRLRFEAVVLDVMLPGKDGFTVAAELRAANHYVPLLMLTARGRPEDVLKGFESGADDYLAKPFELSVLLARINALLRRRDWFSRSSGAGNAQAPVALEEQNEVYQFDDKTIDLGTLELRTKKQTVRLTLMEAQLLRYLIKHEGEVVKRKAMLEDVWGLHEDTDTRAIDNFIVRLRRYIEDEPSRPKHLLTVRGLGYRFLKGSTK